jgi:hypothetical protein
MNGLGQTCFSLRGAAWRWLLAFGVMVGAFGCKPEIGDDCATSIDCSLSGDRLCDVSQPGGYCTVFNCEPNGCPDDAACVAFSEGTCSDAVASTRFRRTFCMATCEDDSDCRSDYRCVDLSSDPARRVVDVNPPTQRICTFPAASSAPPPPPMEPAVCHSSDASFDVSRPEAGTPRDAGDASTDADASEGSLPDGADDRADLGASDRRDGDGSLADGDSSSVETGADILVDSVDTDADDAQDTDVIDAPNVDVPNADVPNADVPNVDAPIEDAPNPDVLDVTSDAAGN